MPITRSAKKAIRVASRRRVFNLRRSQAMKEAIKEARNLVLAGKQSEAASLLPKTYQAIDKAAKRGVIKKNTAGRYKSRLAILISKQTSATT